MYENDVDWRYRVRHLTPTPYGQSEAYYFASAHGPGDLGKEHTRSREIGYNGFSARPDWPWMYACSTRKSPD